MKYVDKRDYTEKKKKVEKRKTWRRRQILNGRRSEEWAEEMVKEQERAADSVYLTASKQTKNKLSAIQLSKEREDASSPIRPQCQATWAEHRAVIGRLRGSWVVTGPEKWRERVPSGGIELEIIKLQRTIEKGAHSRGLGAAFWLAVSFGWSVLIGGLIHMERSDWLIHPILRSDWLVIRTCSEAVGGLCVDYVELTLSHILWCVQCAFAIIIFTTTNQNPCLLPRGSCPKPFQICYFKNNIIQVNEYNLLRIPGPNQPNPGPYHTAK